MEHAIGGVTVSRNWVVGLLTLGGGLAAAGSNSAWFWLLPAFVVGAGAVWALADSESNDPSEAYGDTSSGSTDESVALDTLKRQYAVGEIDDTEFERRLEILLENDSIADVEKRIDVDSETASEAERTEEESTKRSPHHRQKCHRRRKHHHGRH
ncbi:SHOCT domain-containing protein [Natrinema salsiterrestre]|uniref:SHOCT domain-containing protein n=1 Tax=Natrinema salsiterrestre TaxID=2950540 RepID=A0A9Q4L7T2_9EURY|nr:SHOCT domain-containing protein [Natrinema salsiterrestre]MDF9748137.1 SHOCT domain-containing protein [Natrinema salsiterrestre]